MTVKVDIKLDGNRAMENNKTRKFVFTVIGTILLLMFLLVGIVWLEGYNGKNAESPLLKITTPVKDSIPKMIIDNSSHDDHSTKVSIDKVQGDVINGNKVVNYVDKKDTLPPTHRKN